MSHYNSRGLRRSSRVLYRNKQVRVWGGEDDAVENQLQHSVKIRFAGYDGTGKPMYFNAITTYASTALPLVEISIDRTNVTRPSIFHMGAFYSALQNPEHFEFREGYDPEQYDQLRKKRVLRGGMACALLRAILEMALERQWMNAADVLFLEASGGKEQQQENSSTALAQIDQRPLVQYYQKLGFQVEDTKYYQRYQEAMKELESHQNDLTDEIFDQVAKKYKIDLVQVIMSSTIASVLTGLQQNCAQQIDPKQLQIKFDTFK